jgi:hypothetical protein
MRYNDIVDYCFKKYCYPPHWQQTDMVNNYASNGGHEDDSQSRPMRPISMNMNPGHYFSHQINIRLY